VWTGRIAALPRREEAAVEAWARVLAEVAARSPADLDGAVYRTLAQGG
jgi:hypothetical protein